MLNYEGLYDTLLKYEGLCDKARVRHSVVSKLAFPPGVEVDCVLRVVARHESWAHSHESWEPTFLDTAGRHVVKVAVSPPVAAVESKELPCGRAMLGLGFEPSTP